MNNGSYFFVIQKDCNTPLSASFLQNKHYASHHILLVSLDCARHEHGTENHPLCGWKINGYTNKKITIRFI